MAGIVLVLSVTVGVVWACEESAVAAVAATSEDDSMVENLIRTANGSNTHDFCHYRHLSQIHDKLN